MTVTDPAGRSPSLPAPAGDGGTEPASPPSPAPRQRLGAIEILAGVLVLAVLARFWLAGLSESPPVRAWLTVFVSIVVQAMPFVVLGTVLSAVIGTLVPPGFFARALPGRAVLAVPVAGAAGALLPGCECASVPVAGALVRRGVTPAAALAFLLSAPAINPVVLVSTAVAFPGRPQMVVGRFAASLVTAVVMGWLWLRLGRAEWMRPPARADLDGVSRVSAFVASCRHDAAQAGGYLVIGAAAAATLNVVVPPGWLRAVADQPVLSVLALATLAVLLSICSEADAFVASSLTQFSLTARLAFLVVGPMVDLKLFAMQVGAFGRRFAIRFAPATFAVAVVVSVTVGSVLW